MNQTGRPVDASLGGPLTAMTRGWTRPSLPRNVLLNWVSTAVTIVYSLVITPIVVRALDTELYGIWSFLNGLVVYSDLLYLGLGAALVKYIAQHHASGDLAALNRLASVVLSLLTGVGVLCLTITVVAAPFVPRLFAHPLSPPVAAAATYTCVLLGVRILTLFVESAFLCVLVGIDRTDIARVVTTAFTILRFGAVPLFVGGRSPLLALAVVVTASSVLECAVMARTAQIVLRGFKIQRVRPTRSELRLLYGFGLQSFFLQAAVKLISYTDTTVIGLMLGAASVALYSLPLQLIEYGRIGVNGIVAVLLPRLTALYTKGKIDEVGEAYLRTALITCLVAAFVNVNFVFLGVPFLRLWVGPQFAEPARWVLVCLGAASFFQALSTQAPVPFYQAMHRLRFPAAILSCEALVNLALSLAWAPRLGIAGVALATAVPALGISFAVLPRHLSGQLGIPFHRLVRRALLPAVLSASLHSLAFLLLNHIVDTTSYLGLVGKALAAAPAALAGMCIGLSRRDLLSGLSFVRLRVARNRWWVDRAVPR